MEEDIRKIFGEFMDLSDPSQIDIEMSFSEWGMDSVDMVDFIFTIEEEYNIDIPDHVFDNFSTLKNVIDYLNEIIPS